MVYLTFETFMAEYSAAAGVVAPLTDFQKTVLESHLTRLQNHLQHALIMSVLDSKSADVLAAAKTIANSLAVDVEFSRVEKYIP